MNDDERKSAGSVPADHAPHTITISRQMGSLGRRVGQAVADQLEYRIVWREVINQAAMRCGSPEVALAAIDELGLFGFNPPPRACHAYGQAVRQVIEELAAEGGVVIVGRAGQAILADRSNVLHVRVVAPLQVRASRVAAQQKISLECALAQVQASDRFRRNYIKRCYHVNWEDPGLYDLVINTGRTSIEAAARLVCQALTSLG